MGNVFEPKIWDILISDASVPFLETHPITAELLPDFQAALNRVCGHAKIIIIIISTTQ